MGFEPDISAAGRRPGSTILEAAFLAYPDAVLVIDAAGRILMSNPAASALLGYAAEELLAMDVDALMPIAERIRPTERRMYAAPHDSPAAITRFNLLARGKDGSQWPVEVVLSPLEAFGAPALLATIRSVSGYPRVNQVLQRARYSESLARLGHLVVDSRDFQQVLDLVPKSAAQALQVEVAAVYLLDGERRHLEVASCVGDVVGEEMGARIAYDAAGSPGLVVAQGRHLIVKDYRKENRFPVAEAYRRAGLLSAAVVPMHDRGRMIGALAARSRSAGRFGADEVHYLESLANFLGACLQRAQSEAALNHAQRLESVGHLSGGIAHDFNNLLMVIQGNLEVLADLPALAQDANAKSCVDAATRASRRGAELTDQLLSFSRLQLLQPAAVDVRPMLSSLADMLRRTLDQRIDITLALDADCPRIQVDAGQFESSLLNIAINARDAMPQGGRLHFEAKRCEGLPPEIRSGLPPDARPASFVVISVSDTGNGMAPEVRQHAFEPFFTTKPKGRGTGLGLSTVFGFVKQSNGMVAIDSRPGHGTNVTLYMPCAAELAGTPEGVACARPGLPAGLKVLLVEDNAEVRCVTSSFLQALDCRVHAFGDGETALAELAKLGPVDVLLSDIALGMGMRGTALAKSLQQAFPAMAVLMMSGFSAELMAVDREAPPTWELIAKPFSRAELAEAMARALALTAAPS